MSIQLPVKMLPLAPAAAKPAGFVIAVLVGLALFAKQQQSPLSKTNNI